MVKYIKKFVNKLRDYNFRFLCFELVFFSILFGIAFRSWVVCAVMLAGLSWLSNRIRGVSYTIYAMSLLWAFIAFSIGHSISWGWATALGVAFFLLGVGAHLTGLKKPIASTFFSVNQNNIEWLRKGYQRRQNLN